MNASVIALPNSTAEIQKRVAAGKLTWAGPLIMLVARSVLAVICQTLVAAIFYAGSADAWEQAGKWWMVYGTLIDVPCLILLFYLTRREGIRLFDLGNYRREGWLRDVLIGLGLSVPLLLLYVAPTMLLESVLYGGDAPRPAGGLPMVGTLYSLIIWWVIWTFTEDNTYLGYSLPRVEALTGKKWLTVVVVGCFFALQHAFLPLKLEWRWLVSHSAGFLPGTIVYCLLILRWRRLLPIHVIHGLADVASVLAIFFATAGGG